MDTALTLTTDPHFRFHDMPGEQAGDGPSSRIFTGTAAPLHEVAGGVLGRDDAEPRAGPGLDGIHLPVRPGAVGVDGDVTAVRAWLQLVSLKLATTRPGGTIWNSGLAGLT